MSERWEGQTDAKIVEMVRRLDSVDVELRAMSALTTDIRTKLAAMGHLPEAVERSTARVNTLTVALLVASLGLIANLAAGRF